MHFRALAEADVQWENEAINCEKGRRVSPAQLGTENLIHKVHDRPGSLRDRIGQ